MNLIQLIPASIAEKAGFNKEQLLSYGAHAGLSIAGMLCAYNLIRLAKKQDSLLVNGAAAAVGLGGFLLVKSSYGKFFFLGLAVYGAVKTLGLATKAVAKPGDTVSGLGSLGISEALKAKISAFIPNLGEIGDAPQDLVSGNDENQTNGTEDHTGNVDDAVQGFGNSNENLLGENERVEGLGEAALLI